MPKTKCLPCLGRDVKDAIASRIGGVAIQHTLGQIPDCDNEQEIQVCGKTPRAKSAYQEWTSQCMKGKHLKRLDPEAMRDCARQWREKKKAYQ